MLKTIRDMLRPKPKAKKWIHRPEDLPWTDHPDALAQVDARLKAGKFTELQAERARKFISEGYLVLDGGVPAPLIDAYNRDIDQLWDAKQPLPISFLDMFIDDGAIPKHNVTHEEFLKLPPERRIIARDRGNWRVHGFHYHSKPGMEIFNLPVIEETLSMLLGVPSKPIFSISFYYGSQHYIHQDMMVFHIFPRNHLIGIWIAAEDISADSGPLVYYPGSHRAEIWDQFDNYPQTCMRTLRGDDMERRGAYAKYLEAIAAKHERKEFLGKKGDILLWHAMLLHGGSPVKDSKRTRRSFVLHCVPPGFDVADQIVGEKMWDD